MKKKILALLITIALAASVVACGASSSARDSNFDSAMQVRAKSAEPAKAGDSPFTGAWRESADETDMIMSDDYDYEINAAEAEIDTADHEYGDQNTSDSQAPDGNGQESAYKNAKVKLIRKASLTLETKEFNAAIDNLEKMVTEVGGYVEDSSLNQGNYGSSGSSTYRTANYTIRVPSEKYDKFLTMASSEDHCHLASKDESTEDIGQQYFDAETRLKTLRTKMKRLQELLEKAENMEDIITIEREVSDTEYEIENYTSVLNRYDSLVGYSTFNIYIRQVVSVSDSNEIPFVSRVWNSFTGGLEDFVDGVQNFVVWFVGHIFSLALLALIIFAIRKLIRWRKAKRAQEKLEHGNWEPREPREPRKFKKFDLNKFRNARSTSNPSTQQDNSSSEEFHNDAD